MTVYIYYIYTYIHLMTTYISDYTFIQFLMSHLPGKSTCKPQTFSHLRRQCRLLVHLIHQDPYPPWPSLGIKITLSKATIFNWCIYISEKFDYLYVMVKNYCCSLAITDLDLGNHSSFYCQIFRYKKYIHFCNKNNVSNANHKLPAQQTNG